MRLLDFLVFYLTSYFQGRRLNNLSRNSAIGRAGFFIGLIFIFWLVTILELVLFFVGHIDIIDMPRLMGIIIVGTGMLISNLIRIIYISNERYEFIISSTYKPFGLNIYRGVTICILILALGFILLFTGFFVINALDPLKS